RERSRRGPAENRPVGGLRATRGGLAIRGRRLYTLAALHPRGRDARAAAAGRGGSALFRLSGGSGAMRKTFLAAGLVVLAAACGGEKQTEEPAMTPEQPAAEAPAAAPAGTGTVHDVNMVLEGTAYKYVPAELTIKA